MKLSVLIPTYRRPASILRFSQHALSCLSGRHQVEIVFGCHDDDRESFQAVEALPQFSPHGQVRALTIPRYLDGKPHLVFYWNEMFKETGGDLIGFFGDDVLIRSPNWDEEVAREFLSDPHRLIYGNDVHIQKGKFATLFFTHRRTHESFGFYLYPKLRRWYMDEYMDFVFRRAKKILYRPDLIFEHIHPDAFKEAKDQVYTRMDSLITEDDAVWNSAECLRSINRCVGLIRSL